MEGLEGISSHESAEGLYRAICTGRLLLVVCTAILTTLSITTFGPNKGFIGGLGVVLILAWFAPAGIFTLLTENEVLLGRKWTKERAVIKKLPAFRTLCSNVRCTQGEALRNIAQFKECVAFMERLRKS